MQLKQVYQTDLFRDPPEGVLVNHRFIIKQKIGKGSFGSVFKAGIPKLFWYGSEGDYNIMAMELLGSNLEDLMKECGGKLSLQAVLLIADLMDQLKNFEIQTQACIYLSLQSYLQQELRDMPLQMLIQAFVKSKIQRIQFLTLEQSRRDDLESVLYVLIYLLNGQLPWQGVKALNRHEKQTQIMDMKMAIPESMLCHGLPQGFCDALLYIKGLDFEQKPNYEYIKNIFKEIYVKQHFKKTELLFDWQIIRKRKREEKKGFKSVQVEPEQSIMNSNMIDVFPNQKESIKVFQIEEQKNEVKPLTKQIFKKASLDIFQQAFKVHFEKQIQDSLNEIEIKKKQFKEKIAVEIASKLKNLMTNKLKTDSEMSVDDQASFNSEEMRENTPDVLVGNNPTNKSHFLDELKDKEIRELKKQLVDHSSQKLKRNKTQKFSDKKQLVQSPKKAQSNPESEQSSSVYSYSDENKVSVSDLGRQRSKSMFADKSGCLCF
ncbi:casein kinase i [Stylonychia lemnae]|uniref:Casein kinase i n=1 Tax=Stylonychia lemnae TaxID=5949 RepID=A0A078BEG6_STYLE|nr:casein kinase i [Stylonychia lemnae]|eukprot:CDW91547.1 casein kinase i [Stylonychia lemnae]